MKPPFKIVNIYNLYYSCFIQNSATQKKRTELHTKLDIFLKWASYRQIEIELPLLSGVY